jgi:cellulose synthase/poly-beta-1,6-N-acetylglucosamine synthase-like glycosyltransferase
VNDELSPKNGVTIDFQGSTWTQVMTWDFSNGYYPGGWGWGEWRIQDGLLTGYDTDEKFAVYFFPFTHGDNVILETRTRLLRNTSNHHVEAHLLTRDDRAVVSESGMVMVANENRVDVRHMLGTVQSVRETVPTEDRFTRGQWYVMRFILQDGKIDAFVDGEHVFSSARQGLAEESQNGTNGSSSVAVYNEPHVAVRSGVAQFEYVKIFVDRSTPVVFNTSRNFPYRTDIEGRKERHWLVTVILWMFGMVIFIVCVYAIRHYVFTLNRLFGRQRQPYLDVDTAHWPDVTVIVPAHNEEVVIGEILEALLDVDYPRGKLNILPVDDRSKDRTGDIIDDFARRYPKRILPYHRTQGTTGKAAVLNDTIEKVKTDIILIFDADYIPGRSLVKQLVAPFFDPEVGAVMGRVVPYNVGSNLLTRLLDLERAGGYQVDQQARMNMKMVPQYGGTVGGVRKSALISVGGWREDSLAEDTDATYRLLLGGWKTVYQNRSECYEQVPETWKSRMRQIMRWAKGHNQATAHFTLSLLRNHRIRWIEKFDGFLLLGVYMISPILLFGWSLGIILWYLGEPHTSFMFILLVTSYSTLGNFAVFYEITAATQLDGAGERIRLLPFVFLGFLISLFSISRVAFSNVGMNGNGINGKKNDVVWDKTERNTSFNGYNNGRSNHNANRNNPAPDHLRSLLHQETALPKELLAKISSPRLFARLGDAYRGKGEMDKAVKILESGIARDPNFVTTHFVLATCLAEKGDYDSAREEYESILELDPFHFAAMKKLSRLLVDVGKSVEARDLVIHYLGEVPVDEDAEILLADIDLATACHRRDDDQERSEG